VIRVYDFLPLRHENENRDVALAVMAPSLDASTTLGMGKRKRSFLDIVMNDPELSCFSPRPRKMPHNASSVNSQYDHVDTSIASSQNTLE